MDIEVYQKATKIMGRIQVCETLLERLEDTTRYSKNLIKNALVDFASQYGIDFALYVQECLKKEQEAFDALQCCSCDKESEDKEDDGGTTERD